MSPEEKARIEIDKQLNVAGYVVQDMSELNLLVAKGVVVREYPTDTGEVDYLIFVNQQPVGIIEAKAITKGEKLITEVEDQTRRYVNSKFLYFNKSVDIRFVYESTGEITRFTDYNDIKFRSREIFTFHKPEELERLLKETDTLRNRLKCFPQLNEYGFRKCQINAINNLEKSFSQGKPRALIQMATGSGKTFTAITSIYRLLKYCEAKRILFLVDTKNLGEQAEAEFTSYKPNDSNLRFVELYNVQRLKSSYIAESSNVCISTIQRMYSILKGEELDESFEESPITNEKVYAPKEVAYNSKYPIEYFDFIVIDECHRSIYNLWKQVLDYFDAFQIGLTATPDSRTFAYFNENVVSEYSREQAIIDGVNVGEDEYIIETKITKSGAQIAKTNRIIRKRQRLTRKQRWESIDEDIVYEANELDRNVVNPSQIRHIIKEFKRVVETEIFPDRKEFPKTLIFAKSDSHADDIIKIIREEFNEGNEFCRKITYKKESDDDLTPNDKINEFRHGYKFRIAVTVDMIATGTDVKAIECLLFMRDVKSKNYYEQMKGRGTRTISLDEFQKVSPSATTNKDRFILFDAVGVTKSEKSEGRTLDRKPSVPLKDLLTKVALGERDEDTLTTVSGRLNRLEVILTNKEKEEIKTLTGGVELKDIVTNILNAYDLDYLDEKTKQILGKEEITKEEVEIVQTDLIKEAVAPLNNAQLRNYLLKAKQTHEQIIDDINIDTIEFSGWSEAREENVDITIKAFRDFIEENKTKIEALSIIYNQQYKNKHLTKRMIKELYEIMCNPPHNFTVKKMWNCYYIKDSSKVRKSEVNQLIDIISIIKYELGQIDTLDSFATRVKLNFKNWMFKRNSSQGYQFNEEQTYWLQMIRDHIISSLTIEEDDFEYAPFDTLGGLGKYYKLFKNDYLNILNEMNVALIA